MSEETKALLDQETTLPYYCSNSPVEKKSWWWWWRRTNNWQHVIKVILKHVLILVYFLGSSLLTKVVTMYIVIPNVNIERLPQYDLILSHVKKPIPFAFTLTEIITGFLLFILILLCFFNKTHRFSILSRYLFITSSLMNLRAICISVTTLSVPTLEYTHTCHQFQQLSPNERLWRALNIFGFSVGGKRNKKWLTGTRRFLISILLLILLVIGCGGILLAKEHYTVDVLLAVVLSILTCQLYHSNLILQYRNEKKKQPFFLMCLEFDMVDWDSEDNEYDWSVFEHFTKLCDRTEQVETSQS